MIDDIIHIKESDPPTNVTLSFTVPIVTCPPSDLSFALSHLLYDPGHNVGVSSDRLHTGPCCGGATGVSAVQTYNSNSGVASYYAVGGPLSQRYSASNSRGSPLDGYTASCKVCSRLKTTRKTRNRKHRRAAAKLAACARPLVLSTLGRKGKRE